MLAIQRIHAGQVVAAHRIRKITRHQVGLQAIKPAECRGGELARTAAVAGSLGVQEKSIAAGGRAVSTASNLAIGAGRGKASTTPHAAPITSAEVQVANGFSTSESLASTSVGVTKLGQCSASTDTIVGQRHLIGRGHVRHRLVVRSLILSPGVHGTVGC